MIPIKIKNKTKNTSLSEAAMHYTTLVQKARGLMFSKQKDILFSEKKERIIPIHMWFVFYPIDIVYLNKNKIVVEIKENLLPFTFYFPKNKAQYILELKKGSLAQSQTAIGDQLEFR